jgi:predicted lipoprotein with Yx(FWY)xxD motif
MNSDGVGGAAKIGVANSPLGRVVVDNKGRTLYLFEKDKTRRSACNKQCARTWPPLLTHGKPVAHACTPAGTERRPVTPEVAGSSPVAPVS